MSKFILGVFLPAQSVGNSDEILIYLFIYPYSWYVEKKKPPTIVICLEMLSLSATNLTTPSDFQEQL